MSEFQFGLTAPEPQSEAERLMLGLQKRTSAFQNEQDQEPLVSLLTFNLGDEWFALLLDQVKLVSRLLEVAPVPGTSRYVLGVINYKSTIYPLIDIHELLSLESQMPTRASRFVIINHNQYAFAILVDSMTEVKEVRERELEGQIRSNKDISHYIHSELSLNERLLGLLNLDAILHTVAEVD
ncbi:MAG: chemotaxis protein CheW [Chloroflexota bacterium]|nr:chemotaxis protein CheW [Chloroflexota bacterium]